MYSVCVLCTANDDLENKTGQFMGGAVATNGDRFIVSMCVCVCMEPGKSGLQD